MIAENEKTFNGGYVSLWLGKTSSKNTLENYVNIDYNIEDTFAGQLGNDFLIDYYDEDSLETSYTNNSNELRTLLEGHSYCNDGFVDRFIEIHAEQLKDFYNAIVLIYDFKYDESVQEVHNDTFGDFRFMGSVIYNYSSKLLIKHLALKFGKLPWEYEKQLFQLRKHQIVKIYCNFPNIICLKDIEAFL